MRSLRQALLSVQRRFVRHYLQNTSRPDIDTIGTSYGGWRVPTTLLGADATCYCVGAGEDVSFEVGLAQTFGCDVHIFDPTPRAQKHFKQLVASLKAHRPMPVNNNPACTYPGDASLPECLHYHPIGIWSEDGRVKFFAPRSPDHVSHSIINLQQTDSYFEADCHRLSTVMSELDHGHLTLLKLDVEGAEYAVLADMRRSGIQPDVVCVEFDEGHSPIDSSFGGRIRGAIRAMRDYGYQLVDFHDWNACFVRGGLGTPNPGTGEAKSERSAGHSESWRARRRAEG